MSSNKLFNIIVENAKLNIDCGYTVLSNSMLKAKSRKGSCKVLAKDMEINDLGIEYEKQSIELFQKIFEEKNHCSEEANNTISTFRAKYKEEKKKTIRDIDAATERLRNARENARLSQMMLNYDGEMPEIDIQSTSHSEKLQEQLQRAREKIEKMNKKKSQWEATLAELAEIEKNHNGSIIRRQKPKNDFQKIIKS